VHGAALGVLGRRQQLERDPQCLLGLEPAAAVGLRGRELDGERRVAGAQLQRLAQELGGLVDGADRRGVPRRAGEA